MDRKQTSPKAEPLRELHNEEVPRRTHNSGRGHATHTDEGAPKPNVWIEEVDPPRFVDGGIDCSSISDCEGECLRVGRGKELALKRQLFSRNIALAKNTLELEETKLGNFESGVLVDDLLGQLAQLRKIINELREDNAGFKEDLRVLDEAEERMLQTLDQLRCG